MKNRAPFREPFYSGAEGLLFIYFGEIFKGPGGAQQRNGIERKNLTILPMYSILHNLWNQKIDKFK